MSDLSSPWSEPVDLVVVGLGYVGLPLVAEAVRAGMSVVGLDTDAAKVAHLAAGRSPIDDVDDAGVAALLQAGFRPTTDPACIAAAGTVVICVPTPLTAEGGPELAAVRRAAATVAAHLQPATLVVLESTTYPGTTEEVVRPLLESSGLVAGRDFHLVYSPERIDPGNPTFGLANTPKVVGGVTAACTERGAAFYGKLVSEVVVTRGPREAEMAKLLENTYRHVNIALVNEMAVFSHELGVDLWDAIAAASTKPFGFQPFYPGPGVGGHCIPIDPNYLSYRVKLLGYPFRFVELAQEINARMPAYVAARAQHLLNTVAKPVRGARVLLLGVTYKADVSDARESPALPLARRLLDLGADLAYHDPFVASWQVDDRRLERAADLDAAVAAADLVIVLQAHADYDLPGIADRAALVLDTRGRLSGDNVERL